VQETEILITIIIGLIILVAWANGKILAIPHTCKTFLDYILIPEETHIILVILFMQGYREIVTIR
jgi:hypothetical protein